MPQESVERQVEDRVGDAPLAVVLGATRDGRTAVDNARGLLVTVLGEFVLPNGGAAWTQTLIDAMAAVGVQDKATRQALARLAARGWLERSRTGRRARWHLTPVSEALLTDGAARIYGFGADDRSWDGRWSVLLVTPPEGDRAIRYRLGVGLTWAGFGSPRQGVWISPWTDQEAAAAEVVRSLGIHDATALRAEVGALGDGRALAAAAWDLDGVRAHYTTFLDGLRGQHAAAATGEAAVRQLVELVHRWRRFPFLDPELPVELLPADWPSRSAAARFDATRTELHRAAGAWWSERERQYAS